MAEVVVATLGVSFNVDGSDGSGNNQAVLKLEIDDREDGGNGGDTSFDPGESVAYLMFKDAKVSLVGHFVTAGGYSGGGPATKEVEENISFSNSNSSSLGYPPSGAVSMQWLGRSFTITGTSITANAALPEVNGSQLTIPGGKSVAGVLKCTYQATGTLFTLSGVPIDIPEVMILALGTY